MKKGFRVFALLTIFSLLLNSLSILILTIPAKAALTAGNGADIMSNYHPGESSWHSIFYRFSYYWPGDTFIVTLPHGTNEFDCTGLEASGDLSVSPGWSVLSITDSTCTIVIEQSGTPDNLVAVIISNTSHVTNPLLKGTYNINIMTSEAHGELQSPGLNLPVNITTAISDTMSSYTPGENSSHLISYEFNTAPEENDTFTINLPEFVNNDPDPNTPGFDCTGLTTDDVTTSSGWTVTTATPGTCVVVVTAGATPSNPVEVTIADTNIINPTVAGGYDISLLGSTEPSPSFNIPIVIGAGVASDTMSNYNSGAYSSHEITYEFLTNPRKGDMFAVYLPTNDGFDCTGLTYDDVSASSNWEVMYIIPSTCTVLAEAVTENAYNPLTLTIANNLHIKNPITPTGSSYNIRLTGTFEPLEYFTIPVLINGVGTGTGSDTMSSMTAGAHSSHTISYSFTAAPIEDDTFTVTFPTVDGFDCTGLLNTDVTASAGWDGAAIAVNAGLCEVTLTAGISPSNPVEVTIASTNMVNPIGIESYDVSLVGSDESKTIQVAIVDSDTVNITGFVASNLFFDIDTGYGETPAWPITEPENVVDCTASGEFDACYDYSGTGAVRQTNYTVDFGNLTMVDVNKSGAMATHLNGEGYINSIYFDFSTNSASGGVITYKSLYGELRGPAHNADSSLDLDIPSTDGYTDIVAGTSGYGIQLATAPVYKSVGTGTQTVNCSNSVTYCVMGLIDPNTGENTQLAEPIYTVTGPIELGRGKIDVAAAIDGTVVPGSYSDQVTFIATAIY